MAVCEGGIRGGISFRAYQRNWDVEVGFRVVLVGVVGVIGGAHPWPKKGIPAILFWVEWEIAKSCRKFESVAELVEAGLIPIPVLTCPAGGG